MGFFKHLNQRAGTDRSDLGSDYSREKKSEKKYIKRTRTGKKKLLCVQHFALQSFQSYHASDSLRRTTPKRLT